MNEKKNSFGGSFFYWLEKGLGAESFALRRNSHRREAYPATRRGVASERNL